MPVSFSSAARNLFLLGSTGTVANNFFQQVDESSNTLGAWIPKDIIYNYSDQKYIIGGYNTNSNTKDLGWISKRDYDIETDPENPTTTEEWGVSAAATDTSGEVRFNAIKLDYNGDIAAVGYVSEESGPVPLVAKYSSSGVLQWQATSYYGNGIIKDVACDDSGCVYVCGENGMGESFVEKYDDIGQPVWRKVVYTGDAYDDTVLNSIGVNDRGEVVAGGALDTGRTQGYLIKIDTNTGQVLWDKSFTRHYDIQGGNNFGYKAPVGIDELYIDSKDQIYVAGFYGSPTRQWVAKLTGEGNLIWQRGTTNTTNVFGGIGVRPIGIRSDGETEQTIVLSWQGDQTQVYLVLSKYSKDGELVWRRKLDKGNEFSATPLRVYGGSLDADPSFYYLTYVDQNYSPVSGTPDRYYFGKVSSSGNGLGDFDYDDGSAVTLEYTISSLTDTTERLRDGAVRNDTSDLISYPFTASKLVFDDLATPVANKKRQAPQKDLVEFSGSPAVRTVDFETREYTPAEYGVPPQKNYIGLSESLQPASTTSNPSPNNTWTRQTTNVTITANAISNPIGVGSKAEKYNINATTGRRLEYGVPSGVFVAGQRYTYSWWMKAITTNTDWQFQALQAGSSNSTIRIADRDGNILEDRGSAGSYKPNDTDWHRVVWTFTANNTTGSAIGGYNGNSATGDLWYLWGAQLVDGPDPLRYYRNHNGVPENAAGTEHAPSIVNGYYEFDQSEILQIGEVPEIGNEFTVEIWFKSDSHSNWQNPIDCNYGSQDLSGNGSVNSGNIGPRLEINAAGSFFWAFGATLAANDPYFALPAGSGSTNVWYHSVIAYDGSGATGGKSYLNGENVFTSYQSTSGTAAWVGEFRNVILGRGFTLATRYFDGQIGEVRIYPKALTEAQVFQNYNATKSKYINEAPDTAPRVGPNIVTDSNLLLNYDFGNRATYDRAENVVKYSEDFKVDEVQSWGDTNTNWLDKSKLTSNYAMSPFGEMTATRVANDTGSDKYLNYRPNYSGNGSIDVSGQWTVSAFVKPLSNPCTIQLTQWDGFTESRGVFNLVSGTLSSSNATDANTIEEVGGGWYRISSTATNGNTNTAFQPKFFDGTDLLLYGAQMESGSTLGRYIRTYGSAITAPTKVKNLSGTSIDGTINLAPFNSGGWFEFDGSSNSGTRIAFNSSEIDLSGNFSIDMWFRQGDQSADYYMLLGASGYGSNGENGIGHYLYGNAIVTWAQDSLGSNTTVNIWDSSSTTTLTSGVWYNLILTRQSGTAWRWYLNGSLVNSNTTQFLSVDFTSANTYIGDHYNSDYQFDGDIGEVRMYNKALDSTEVSQNFNATRGKYGV